ncbi:nuclear transport factor 2 family protein [Croceicoccus sp. F390]|uniref:Nuclear transport factor 2 family protein n=1 Tax=Croceicoccus esteveae TaxID=3075597 RepID=A0ABU2ZHA7_9SPHN|nr:nuclear transport factor 2 family protein [Croceicoccus sp. F390]MDT0575975.1 nuclear transport factor 2 family protein [Croceicoccus sp. F390]
MTGSKLTDEAACQLVNDLFAATGSGDWQKAASMLTDDLVIHEADCVPMAGEYHGKDALQQLYTDVFTRLDVAELEQLGQTVGGDYVINIARMHFAQPGPEHPRLRPAELCERFTIRDGKVSEIKPYYFDPTALTAAAEAKQKGG